MKRLTPLLLLAACALEEPASFESEQQVSATATRMDPHTIHHTRPGDLMFLLEQSMVCWVSEPAGYGRARIDVVGMESARVDTLQLVTVPGAFSDQRVTRVGDQLALAGLGTSGAHVVLMNPSTGQVEEHYPVPTGHLYVAGSYLWGDFGYTSSARRYDSPLDLYHDDGTDFTFPVDTIIGSGAEWLPSWGLSTRRVRLYDPNTGVLDRTLRLQGVEDTFSVLALQQTTDHIVLLGHDTTGENAPRVLSVFDLATGDNLTNVVFDTLTPNAFICEGSLL